MAVPVRELVHLRGKAKHNTYIHIHTYIYIYMINPEGGGMGVNPFSMRVRVCARVQNRGETLKFIRQKGCAEWKHSDERL